MVRFLIAVRVTLAVALALLNAVCFVQCLVQSCDGNPMPCHSHAPAKAHACPPQHDLRIVPASLSTATAALNAAGPVEVADHSAAQPRDPADFASPAPLSTGAPKPLRI